MSRELTSAQFEGEKLINAMHVLNLFLYLEIKVTEMWLETHTPIKVTPVTFFLMKRSLRYAFMGL